MLACVDVKVAKVSVTPVVAVVVAVDVTSPRVAVVVRRTDSVVVRVDVTVLTCVFDGEGSVSVLVTSPDSTFVWEFETICVSVVVVAIEADLFGDCEGVFDMDSDAVFGCTAVTEVLVGDKDCECDSASDTEGLLVADDDIEVDGEVDLFDKVTRPLVDTAYVDVGVRVEVPSRRRVLVGVPILTDMVGVLDVVPDDDLVSECDMEAVAVTLVDEDVELDIVIVALSEGD